MNIGHRGGEGRGIRAGEEALLGSALETVEGLNERCLEVLQRLAIAHSVEFPKSLASIAPLFRTLAAPTIRALSRQPFLLVDFSFSNVRVFQELLARGTRPLQFPNPRGILPTADATMLARGALTLAQAVCRHHPAHAGLLLGIDPALRGSIAQLRVAELDRLADENPQHLRLRWESRLLVWRRLLSTEPERVGQFRLYGMQLMAGDLSRTTRAPH